MLIFLVVLAGITFAILVANAVFGTDSLFERIGFLSGKIVNIIRSVLLYFSITFSLLKLLLILTAFIFIGPFLLFLLVAIGLPIILIRMPAYNSEFEKFKRELEGYLDAAIPAIFSDWSSQELIRRASPIFLGIVEKNELQKGFEQCRNTLGKLTCNQVSRECLRYASGLGSPSNSGKFNNKKSKNKRWNIYLANFETVVIFERGMANFETQIIKNNGHYSINSMHINIGSKSCNKSFRFGIETTIDALKSSRILQEYLGIA
jgi:hypothetical protein